MATVSKPIVAMASVYLTEDDVPFIVAESPSEIVDLWHVAMRAQQPTLMKLTLATFSEWNGKPLMVNPKCLRAVSPPKVMDESQDTDD